MCVSDSKGFLLKILYLLSGCRLGFQELIQLCSVFFFLTWKQKDIATIWASNSGKIDIPVPNKNKFHPKNSIPFSLEKIKSVSLPFKCINVISFNREILKYKEIRKFKWGIL
jgi:hypothetical protein